MPRHAIIVVFATLLTNLFSVPSEAACLTDMTGGSPGHQGPRKVEELPLVTYGSPQMQDRNQDYRASSGFSLLGEGSGSFTKSPAFRIALAFLVPGLPQYLDGKLRSYGYFAVEGTSIASLIVLNSQGNIRRNRYIELSETARRNYVYPGLRNNPTEVSDPAAGGFGEYYEDLTKWPSSGDYDDDPSREGVQPETNPGTYNGHQWEIAKINSYSGTSGGLPVSQGIQEEINALEAYKRSVYPKELNWDWTGLDREETRYHEAFHSYDDAKRRRSTFTALLVANHLVSGIDMLIQERLSRSLQKARLELHLKLRKRKMTYGRDALQGLQPAFTLSRRF